LDDELTGNGRRDQAFASAGLAQRPALLAACWRGLIIFVAVIGLAAIGLSWSWLVAVGIAPLLLAFAPCAAMCALGLCASRMLGSSCSSETGTTGDAASQAARPEALSAAAPDPNQLTLASTIAAPRPGRRWSPRRRPRLRQ
jgi:hypothetical protein